MNPRTYAPFPGRVRHPEGPSGIQGRTRGVVVLVRPHFSFHRKILSGSGRPRLLRWPPQEKRVRGTGTVLLGNPLTLVFPPPDLKQREGIWFQCGSSSSSPSPGEGQLGRRRSQKIWTEKKGRGLTEWEVRRMSSAQPPASGTPALWPTQTLSLYFPSKAGDPLLPNTVRGQAGYEGRRRMQIRKDLPGLWLEK